MNKGYVWHTTEPAIKVNQVRVSVLCVHFTSCTQLIQLQSYWSSWKMIGNQFFHVIFIFLTVSEIKLRLEWRAYLGSWFYQYEGISGALTSPQGMPSNLQMWRPSFPMFILTACIFCLCFRKGHFGCVGERSSCANNGKLYYVYSSILVYVYMQVFLTIITG